MTTLKAGDKAPKINAVNQNDEQITLDQFLGKKIVLYFYPKDDTPGCTAEACDLRDNYNSFIQNGYIVIGVSPDTAAKHQKFIAKYNLPFDLIADTDQTVAIAFGVWVEKNMYGRKYMGIARTTFIIDAEGIIEKIIEKVNTKAHTSQILG
jgi:thioredoxin-dependent peroxiredoxin